MTRSRETVAAVVWLVLAGGLTLLNFADRSKPAKDVFFRWDTFAAEAAASVIFFIVPALVLCRGDRELLGLVRPKRLGRTVGWALVALVGVAVLDAVVGQFGQPEKEQGIAPTHWIPHHTAAFVANLLVVATLVPISEELFFRGAGYGLLARMYSVPGAIILSGTLFGLAHGIWLAIPPLAFLGIMLAVMRSTSTSIVPGIVLHGLYNALAIVLTITGH